MNSSKGELKNAIEYYDKSLKINVKNFGENHPEVASTYSNMAMCAVTEVIGWIEHLSTTRSLSPSESTALMKIILVWLILTITLPMCTVIKVNSIRLSINTTSLSPSD